MIPARRLSIEVKLHSNRDRSEKQCQYELNWTGSYLRDKAFQLLDLNPSAPFQVHLEDSSGTKLPINLSEARNLQNIPPSTILIIDTVGLPANVGPISDLLLDPKDYVFKDKLGAGSYGEVWSGVHEKTGKPVALKKLLRVPKEGIMDREFQRELLIGYSLPHPSILPVLGYFPSSETGNYLTIVFPLMANDSVQSAICKQRPNGIPGTQDKEPSEFANITAKVKILMGIAAGMVFMHDRIIIHRDLKPENVLLDEFGDPQISDFGSAKAIPTREGLQNSIERGSPLYQAPESILGESTGVKADVYSFGLMIYAILTGTSPFPVSDTIHRVWTKIVDGIRPTFPSDTPAVLVDLAESCWAPRPDDRPTSLEVLHYLCSRKFLESFPDLDLTILRDFASRTVPPELRGFLARSRKVRPETSLLIELVRVRRKFPVGAVPDRGEEDEHFVINSLLKSSGGGDGPAINSLRDACKKAAELGDPTAMCELALSLSLSTATDDKRDAVKWMKQAADRGCGRAGTYYVRMIADGNGDIDKYGCWEDTQNRCQKLFDFATEYHRGNRVEKNIQEAIRLYELAADCGHSESCFALSEIYRTGEDGIPPNPARSILYARRTYEKGLEGGQQGDERNFLGLIQMSALMSSGFDTIRQDAEHSTKLLAEHSTKLLEIAHRKYFAFQQYRYAQRLKSGRGVHQDDEKSRYYFDLAASHGFPVCNRDLPRH
jgi:serine/threonine protein kinase/TPR repeat protein